LSGQKFPLEGERRPQGKKNISEKKNSTEKKEVRRRERKKQWGIPGKYHKKKQQTGIKGEGVPETLEG